ncbi:MAG: nucleoside-diphosphate kinase [Candidatus Kaiserbacteria bacterium]|nr:nucleoside-diphosphate kinase [Candidatus Kaiserbacteria bacterium]
MDDIRRQRTLVILKPDSIQRALVGEIIRRFERVGLKLTALKMVVADADMVEQHYLAEPTWREQVGKKILENKGGESDGKTAEELGDAVLQQLKRFMTAGPIIVMILEGAGAVPLVRKLVGSTEPLSSDVGTIRGDFVLDSYQLADGSGRAIRNAIHASGTPEEAEREIAIWFTSDEIVSYQTVYEHILYDVNFDNDLD